MELPSIREVKKMAKQNLADKVIKDAYTSETASASELSLDDLQTKGALNTALTNIPLVKDTACSGKQLYQLIMNVMKGISTLRRYHYKKLYDDHGNKKLKEEKWGKAYFKKILPASPKKYERSIKTDASAELPLPTVANPFTAGKQIAKNDIAKFFTDLEALWEAQYSKNEITYTESTCHSNCHSNCHGACHSSCNRSCNCNCNCNCNWETVRDVNGESHNSRPNFGKGKDGWNVTTASGHQYNVGHNEGEGWRVVHTPVGDRIQVNSRDMRTKPGHR